METEIIEFLREKFREKMGRNVGDSEINDFIRIAEAKSKFFREALNADLYKLLLQYKCKKCNCGTIEIDGFCGVCKICEDYNIADLKEFKKFFKDNSIVGGFRLRTSKIVETYKSQIATNGGI